jgi:hypothetical protein
MSKRAKELLQRVATWPEEDLEKLEAAARQIEAWRSGLYEASEEELRAIDEAIAELDRGQVATAEEVEAAFRSFRHA